jgi:guanyl-specific ribonuclease Sa
MRKILAAIAILQLAISGAAAQSQSATKAETLSLEQKTKISQLISARTAPLPSGKFSIAVDAVVPADVQVHALPAEAEQVAPQVRGFGYLVVEEQIALVDQGSRKVEIVFPRWLEP